MPLTVTVVAGHNFPEATPLTLDALRRAALPNVTIAGSVATGDLADGAVTPPKCSPGAYWFGLATWLDPTYSVTVVPALTGYADGVEVWIKTPATSDNTGIANLNVSGRGAKKIFKQGGLPLVAGDIRSERLYGFRYNATLDTAAGGWELINEPGNPPHTYATAAGSVNALTVAFTPAVKSLLALHGQPIFVRIGAALGNTAACTLNVDGLGAKPILKRGEIPLGGGELKPNQVVALVYDSNLNTTGAFELISHPDQPVIAAASKNLQITIQTASTVKIEADQVVVHAGLATLSRPDHVTLKSVTVLADIAGSVGPNGLDTGTKTTNTRYWLWVIYNGATVASLLSLSGLSPTLPSGYTHMACVGAVWVNSTGGGEFDRHWELGERIRFVSQLVTPSIGALAIDTPHYLPRRPSSVRGFLKVINAQLGYAAGDVIDVSGVADLSQQLNVSVGANADNVWLMNEQEPYIMNKSTQVWTAIDGAGPVYADFAWFIVAEA